MLKRVLSSVLIHCFFYGFSFKLVYNKSHEAVNPGGHPFGSGTTPRGPREKNRKSTEMCEVFKMLKSKNIRIVI